MILNSFKETILRNQQVVIHFETPNNSILPIFFHTHIKKNIYNLLVTLKYRRAFHSSCRCCHWEKPWHGRRQTAATAGCWWAGAAGERTAVGRAAGTAWRDFDETDRENTLSLSCQQLPAAGMSRPKRLIVVHEPTTRVAGSFSGYIRRKQWISLSLEHILWCS